MDLEKRYAKYTDHQLLEALEKRDDFTPYAVEVAYKELQKRKLSREDIERYVETRRKEKSKDYYKENVLALPTYKKFLFFLMVIPYLIPLFTSFYKLEGELLKLNQGKYYSIMGFVAFAIGSFREAIIKVEWLFYCNFITVFLALFFVAKRFESVFLPIFLSE
ncbi:hypothetical protein [Leadbetterella byssophila]|uniref:hypothetical protein n=1 Tax=Leadbetterella byssophila TaxID=316068 RepID=UPI0039A190CC